MERLTKIEKQFSKQESAAERATLAEQVQEKRAAYFAQKREQEMRNEQVAEVVKDVEGLQKKIEAHHASGFFEKIKNVIAIKKVEAELREKSGEKTTLEEALAKPMPGAKGMEEAREMLSSFYQQEKQKWAEAPYSKEDIASLFSEEHLASLSLEDYAALLRRFPGEMVTHVTRQGVRDHVGMYEHMAGMGEMHNGFKGITQSGRLTTRLGAAMMEARTAHDICEALNGGKPVVTGRDVMGKHMVESTSPQVLVARLRGYTDRAKEFHDSTAIHLAMGKVLDEIYGGERGNEVFIAYPAAHVASQYNFLNIQGKGVTKAPDDDRYNDLYVWAENEWKGMNIDAGIVFLPSGVQVDKISGSQFALDEQGMPIEREFEEGEDTVNRRVYKRSEQIVDSKEYWEAYFAEHPNNRPSKIIYYDGRMTPTEALWEWKGKNGIVDKAQAATLGFDEYELHEFDRPGAEEAALHFYRTAVDALVREYGMGIMLPCFDHQVFTKPQDEWQNSINDMYKEDGMKW
ncbi:MAG: hypothetical protein ACD_81C00155G0004 [uncultured bacterium]|uniref:Uncharacterized protein n=2 Tax=Candidatus Wolfeibacteriota TaxID=1752735 RepID=A0A0G1H908_9BACT|nr:MAG: hypothetical protein ACD_81C00155G0004 [uncultured bacterium]KKR12367.1 MAG: hypothetical protein UT41_C0002G0141 [Candidatus Wolfebacteria bacterium GW2011_GWC2_39_22]KKT43275.1 MAG: hypothetical protein UW32_C0002G0136 [Candidatus Wolfebacteria bacterium GW2011_GWE2_44_13]HBI25993.1 hypothetical protein [Candidatus Wolfebacteria bacterium]